MNVRRIDDAEHTKLFNERCFNPPKERTQVNEERFSQEFQQALDAVRAFCNVEFTTISEGEDHAFFVWPYYNWSRVIDVEITVEDFLCQEVVSRLQAVLQSLPESWTVILSGGDTLFVSPEEVLAYLPCPDLIESVDVSWIGTSPNAESTEGTQPR